MLLSKKYQPGFLFPGLLLCVSCSWTNAVDWFYDSPPPKPAISFDERFMAARHDEGRYEENILTCFFACRGLSNDLTSGWQGSPYSSRYGWMLASKPAISSKTSWGARAAVVERLHYEYDCCRRVFFLFVCLFFFFFFFAEARVAPLFLMRPSLFRGKVVRSYALRHASR